MSKKQSRRYLKKIVRQREKGIDGLPFREKMVGRVAARGYQSAVVSRSKPELTEEFQEV